MLRVAPAHGLPELAACSGTAHAWYGIQLALTMAVVDGPAVSASSRLFGVLTNCASCDMLCDRLSAGAPFAYTHAEDE